VHNPFAKCVTRISKKKICPLCNEPIVSAKDNFAFNELMRNKVPVLEVFELIVLDTSSSMWWSDIRWSFGLVGMSRLDVAKKWIESVVLQRCEQNRKVKASSTFALITFDSQCLAHCDPQKPAEFIGTFETLKPELKASGAETCIYDALELACQVLEKYSDRERRIIFITDGGDSGHSKADNLDKHRQRGQLLTSQRRQLSASLLYVNVGGSPRKNVANDLDADNYMEVTSSTIKYVSNAYLARNPSTSAVNVEPNPDVLSLPAMALPDTPTHAPGSKSNSVKSSAGKSQSNKSVQIQLGS